VLAIEVRQPAKRVEIGARRPTDRDLVAARVVTGRGGNRGAPALAPEISDVLGCKVLVEMGVQRVAPQGLV
jgi:hypothetical protein